MMYHERQSRQLCALHVLNNLFQDSTAFSQADLDSVCYRLAPDRWINPHKSLIGLGNYDVNVIMAALQDKGFDTLWFDKRRNIESLNLERIFGFILNVPSSFRLLSIFNQRHWIAIRFFEADKLYFNLDSNLEKPKVIGTGDDLIDFFKKELSIKEKELILVLKDTVSKETIWKS